MTKNTMQNKVQSLFTNTKKALDYKGDNVKVAPVNLIIGGSK
jgi:hypothetical protein